MSCTNLNLKIIKVKVTEVTIKVFWFSKISISPIDLDTQTTRTSLDHEDTKYSFAAVAGPRGSDDQPANAFQ